MFFSPEGTVVYQRSKDGKAWYINGVFYPRNAASISREWDEPARESDPEFKDGESVLRESPSPAVFQKRLMSWWQKNKIKYPLPVLMRLQEIHLKRIELYYESKTSFLKNKQVYRIQADRAPHGSTIIGPKSEDLARLDELMRQDTLDRSQLDELEKLQRVLVRKGLNVMKSVKMHYITF